jgi:hypothetical protein
VLDFLPSLWNLANVKYKKNWCNCLFPICFQVAHGARLCCTTHVAYTLNFKCLGMESNEMNNDLGFKIASKWRKFEDNNDTHQTYHKHWILASSCLSDLEDSTKTCYILFKSKCTPNHWKLFQVWRTVAVTFATLWKLLSYFRLPQYKALIIIQTFAFDVGKTRKQEFGHLFKCTKMFNLKLDSSSYRWTTYTHHYGIILVS